MAPDFPQILADARVGAATMKEAATRAFAKDQHPAFWEYSADLATRWSDALSASTPDWGVLGLLREEAQKEKHRAGVWLYAFCSGIEKAYVELRQAALLKEADPRRPENNARAVT